MHFTELKFFILIIPICFTQNLDNLQSTLRQVHVVFRHGDRTPDVNTYPLDPYKDEAYYPIGRGMLTNKGKNQEYKIGLNLRNRYREFLGDIYIPDLLEARSTDMPRTKMSLQLVLAGLWPPTDLQSWHPFLNWQPIPYIYDKFVEDEVLTNIHLCSNFLKKYNKIYNSLEMQAAVEEFNWVYDYVNQHTGMNATRFYHLAGLYFSLTTEKGLGFKLPDWTELVYPDVLERITIFDYLLKTYNTEMKRLAVGGFIQKIKNDIEANIEEKPSKKLYLYSGHEFNVAFMLSALDVFALFPHVPSYGSYVTLELHKIDERYGIQAFYNDYSVDTPTNIFIPGCDAFCPIEIFFSMVEKLYNDCKLFDLKINMF